MIDILNVAAGCQDAEELLAELKGMRDSRAKLYRTFVSYEDESDVGEKGCVFMTTSKDTHLALGRLSEKGQNNFMSVIVQTLRIEKQTMGLVSIPEENGSLLATMTEDTDTVTILLNPAR